jgi:hypothetical protein
VLRGSCHQAAPDSRSDETTSIYDENVTCYSQVECRMKSAVVAYSASNRAGLTQDAPIRIERLYTPVHSLRSPEAV